MIAPLLMTMLLCGFADGDAAHSEAEIAALIDRLASPNARPTIDGPDADYPEGFDKVAQDRVMAAWRKLHEIGLPAFPQLHTRLGDERYGFTKDTGEAETNFSVGRACESIIDGHLQPFGYITEGEEDYRSRPRRPRYFTAHALEKPGNFKAWWRGHKGRTMREIQIEVLEWVIAQEGREPEKYSVDEIGYLKGLLLGLRRSDEPLPPSYPYAR